MVNRINPEHVAVAGTGTERCWLMRHGRADHLPAPPVLQRGTPQSQHGQGELCDPKCHLRYLKLPLLVAQIRQQGWVKGCHPDKRLRFAERGEPEEKYLTRLEWREEKPCFDFV